MLHTPAPFPQAGCHALFVDPTLPVGQQRAELVRVHIRDAAIGDAAATTRITFPLRPGSSGYRRVAESELIDGTPLTKAEERELADLRRALSGLPATSRHARKFRRAQDLQDRLLFSQLMARELDKLDRLGTRSVTRTGGSRGALMPRDAGAALDRGVA